MTIERIMWSFFAVVFAILVAGIIRGGVKMNNENASIKNDCIKTNLVIIGNKGHVTSVYDCSVLEVSDE